ncbi:MAG: radical SAM protein [Bacteriovoracaceae bacterium]|nr:radical SAM protein [Bacteriovoracaceae bacterium]
MAKHLFGPVVSRRLGRSLGVDMVPAKTCNMNCVYCECGPTPKLAEGRASFFPVQEVLEELAATLPHTPLDVVTFSGSGEPMLSLDVPVVLDFIKRHYPQLKTAMITNGTLLGPQERKELQGFDYILPALHAADEKIWKRIVRSKVALKTVVEGLIKLREEFSGQINLEVFLIPGINDQKEQQAPLAALIKKIKPDVIELNSLDRPGTLDWVKPCPAATLQAWAQGLADLTGIKTTIIARHAASPVPTTWAATDALHAWPAAYALLARRPAGRDDLVQACAVPPSQLDQWLQTWLAQHKIIQQGNFFCLAPQGLPEEARPRKSAKRAQKNPAEAGPFV